MKFKKMVHKDYEIFNIYDFEGDIDSIIEKLNKFKERYGGDAKFEIIPDIDEDYKENAVFPIYYFQISKENPSKLYNENELIPLMKNNRSYCKKKLLERLKREYEQDDFK